MVISDQLGVSKNANQKVRLENAKLDSLIYYLLLSVFLSLSDFLLLFSKG